MPKRRKSVFGLSQGERIFEAVNITTLVIIGVIMIFPFVNMLAVSFSGDSAVLTGKVILWPVDFQTSTYRYVTGQNQFWNSLKVTVLTTILGTIGSMAVTCMAAYPLAKTWLYGRKPFMLFFVFTMLFSGGMVPSYLVMRAFGMINKLSVLIIPSLISAYNTILLKNFFEEIPEEIEESAQLDGAGSMRTLLSIILPMSLPALATIGLYYAVSYWNNYTNALLYITKNNLKPLQLYLYEVVSQTLNIDDSLSMDEIDVLALTTESVRSATIMLSCLPIMCFYPFLQKYFVKGLRVGSVKG